MTVDLYTSEKGGKQTIAHYLNFAKGKYEAKHNVVFKSPSAALINLLRETGPVPGDENGARKKDKLVRAKKASGTVDMEKLAEGLLKLGEDDLLHVVQMIHDNKSEDSYTKNDIEREFPESPAPLLLANSALEGEFHVDLYTLPESLVKMLWDFVSSSSRTA